MVLVSGFTTTMHSSRSRTAVIHPIQNGYSESDVNNGRDQSRSGGLPYDANDHDSWLIRQQHGQNHRQHQQQQQPQPQQRQHLHGVHSHHDSKGEHRRSSLDPHFAPANGHSPHFVQTPSLGRSQTVFEDHNKGSDNFLSSSHDSPTRARRKGRVDKGFVAHANSLGNHLQHRTSQHHDRHSLRHSHSEHLTSGHSPTSHSIYMTQQPDRYSQDNLPTHYSSMVITNTDHHITKLKTKVKIPETLRGKSLTSTKSTTRPHNGVLRGASSPLIDTNTPRHDTRMSSDLGHRPRGQSFPNRDAIQNGSLTASTSDGLYTHKATENDHRYSTSTLPRKTKRSSIDEFEDSPYARMTALDTWSPNYVKLSFFMGKKNKDSHVADTENHIPKTQGTSGVPFQSNGNETSEYLSNKTPNFKREEHKLSGKKSSNSSNCSSNSNDTSDTYITMKSVTHFGNSPINSEVCIPSEYPEMSSRGSKFQSHDMENNEDTLSTRSTSSFGHYRPDRFSTGSHMNRSSPMVQSVYGTLPRRHNERVLRRSVSHDPRSPAENQKTPPVVRTSSDGEIESEYVTLDYRYVLNNSSRLDRVAEITVTSEQSGNPSLKVQTCAEDSLLNKDKNNFSHNTNSMNKTHRQIHNHQSSDRHVISHPTNLLSPTSNLLTASKSMQSLPTNPTLVDSKRSSLKKKNGSATLRTVAETIGSVFSPLKTGTSRGSGSPRSVDSFRDMPSFDGDDTSLSTNRVGSTRRPSLSQEQRMKMTRSKSLPDLQVEDVDNEKSGEGRICGNFSDDEDGDDFGFLSYPVAFRCSNTSFSSSSTAMHKAAKSSPGSRIFPKRWRSKTKSYGSTSAATAMWTPGPLGSCTWSSVSGRKVHLRPVSVLHLSEAERMALQKIALSKLQNMDLGCPIAIPKECSEQRRAKKALSLKRRSKSVSASALDSLFKDGVGSGLVFGIPLGKCVVNDRELEKKKKRTTSPPGSMRMRTDSSENVSSAARPLRKSSSSSQEDAVDGHQHVTAHNGNLSPHTSDHITVPAAHKRAASSDSLSESESSRNTSSSLIDALSLSTNPASRIGSLTVDAPSSTTSWDAHVPYVVKACFRHIETFGLHTLGIFRVGSSKKRVKQLREEFDSGREVQLSEDYHPHDVAALLKEYFRDLPEPLLSRELYLPFLHAKRLKDCHKSQTAMRLLISMLPVANRDTLWALLRFLATVSQNAMDSTDEKGETVPGNKMDTHNLATLFGPNILHRSKASTDKELMAESAERVEQSKEVITVVKDIIDNHHDLFEISGSLRDDVLRLLIESDQETADKILKCLANQSVIEADPESMCSVFEDSANSPMLHHNMNSDADLLSVSRRQTSTTHRPLRVTKSAEDTIDSPVSSSCRITHLSESQALSPSSKDNKRASSGLNISSSQRPTFDLGPVYANPVPRQVPILKISHDGFHPEVILRGRLETAGLERPCSETFNQSLHIPRPLYLRENSSSSMGSSSGLSSSLNSHGGSENSQAGQWVLPTPPGSRGSSPKHFFRSTSSSSTLIGSSTSPNRLSHSNSQDDNFENTPPYGSAEWERERWRHWEQMAAKKKNPESEQETLV